MAQALSNVPYNLQFSSYANYRDPNWGQLNQMLGGSKASDAMTADIAAAEREDEYSMWQEEWDVEKEGLLLTQEQQQEDLDYYKALYAELKDYLPEMYGT